MNLHQDYLHMLQNHLNKLLDIFLLRLLPASIMLQGSSVGITAIIQIQKHLLYYRTHLTIKRLRHGNTRLMIKLILTSQKSGLLLLANPIFYYDIVLSTKAFINRA